MERIPDHLRRGKLAELDRAILASNPGRKIKPRGEAPTGRTAHTDKERAALKSAAADEWLSACWLLSLAGLRRSEVLGLRWSDVDLEHGIVTISRGRVLVDTKNVTEGDPKSHNSARQLSIPTSYVEALKEMRAKHAEHLGEAHVADGYLAITEIGEPMRPRLYSEHWKRLCRKAKVRELTLHEARHSSVSLMRSKGISDQVIAAYHGHDEQTMRRTYSHLMPGDLDKSPRCCDRLITRSGPDETPPPLPGPRTGPPMAASSRLTPRGGGRELVHALPSCSLGGQAAGYMSGSRPRPNACWLVREKIHPTARCHRTNLCAEAKKTSEVQSGAHYRTHVRPTTVRSWATRVRLSGRRPPGTQRPGVTVSPQDVTTATRSRSRSDLRQWVIPSTRTTATRVPVDPASA